MIIRFCLLWCFFGRGRPTPKYSYKNSPLLSFPELCGLVTPWKIHTNAPKIHQGFKTSRVQYRYFNFLLSFQNFFRCSHFLPGGGIFSKPFMGFGETPSQLGCCCSPGAVLEQSFQSREVDPPSRVKRVGFG